MTDEHDFEPSPDAIPARPDYLPEKFWDSEAGEVKTEDLARSYQELERRLGSDGLGVPDAPDGYSIQAKDPNLTVDPEINARLHEAGFTQEQAQMVYDLAGEKLGPVVGDLLGRMEAQRQVERLAEHFGGTEKWGELSQQMAAWGRSNLPPDVFEALASSYDGVLALHRMMSDGEKEPGLGRADGSGGGPVGEAQLRKMMDDPRYWRDQDPDYMRQVQQGFEKLYGGS